MSKHPVLCSILKQINDDHQYPDDPFVALADFKTILERQTPNSSGAKLLTASHCITSLRKQALGYADALRRSVGGNLSENALTNAPSSASISMDSPRLLQFSYEKELPIEKLKYVTSPQDKKQKAATALLRDELQKQDFAKPVSLRVSRILGPVSRFRIAQILPR